MPDYDMGLHLLDRQIVGADDRLVAKVDDVELTRGDDGSLTPTAILVGAPALLPRMGDRMGGWLMRMFRLTREAAADRDLPLLIGMDLVDRVESEVRLTVPGHGRLQRMDRVRADDRTRCRVGQILGTPVVCDRLPRRSKVLDLRMLGTPGGAGPHRVTSLIVGPDRPGALLGYDRRSEPGPAPVAAFVQWLHRHARVVELGRGVEIDLDAGEVRIGPEASLLPLRG
ncbi:hypothetical protein GCM10022237_20860 [Nocardioides ginsengisoli]|uniref:Uncharacterized protein n=1 Tax=Nocardioides ginsengisoli TaxID=363868 RepID=A0ABW3W1Q6_9ACTN